MKKLFILLATLSLAAGVFALPYSHRVYTKAEVDAKVEAVTTAHTQTVALAASAVQPLAEGVFAVADSTQLVFIASGVTNVIDADITTP